MSRATILAVVVCYFCTIGLAADPTPVPFDVAVKTGLVDVEVKGRGVCSGDAIRVEVRRKAGRAIHVVVEPGTVVESTSGKVQRMVCHGVKYQKAGDKYRRVDVMVLNDDAPQTFLLEADCGDFSKPTPGADSSFHVGSADRPAARVIAKGKEAGANTFQVLAVDQNGVRVELTSREGEPPRRGWIALEHVKLAGGAPRGEGRPFLRKLGELVSEAELEVITASERGP